MCLTSILHVAWRRYTVVPAAFQMVLQQCLNCRALLPCFASRIFGQRHGQSFGQHIISIKQELELTRHYLAIQQVRFHGLLNVHYDIDQSLIHYRTIKLILQPFVENCIHHAIWDDDARVNIRITLSEKDGNILLQVIDDGMGMTADTLARAHSKTDFSSGYGIRNVDERVKLAFGEQYGVEFYSRLGIGTQVMIRFPKKIAV